MAAGIAFSLRKQVLQNRISGSLEAFSLARRLIQSFRPQKTARPFNMIEIDPRSKRHTGFLLQSNPSISQYVFGMCSQEQSTHRDVHSVDKGLRKKIVLHPIGSESNNSCFEVWLERSPPRSFHSREYRRKLSDDQEINSA
jgi:hypothetical protein